MHYLQTDVKRIAISDVPATCRYCSIFISISLHTEIDVCENANSEQQPVSQTE